MFCGLAYTGLLITSITATAGEVLNILIKRSELCSASPCNQNHPPAMTKDPAGGINVTSLPLRETYIKVATLVGAVGKHMGFQLVIQLLYHGLYIVVYTATVTDKARFVNSGSSLIALFKTLLVLVAHAAIVFKILRAAELMVGKVVAQIYLRHLCHA
jgi:hypothetical protein